MSNAPAWNCVLLTTTPTRLAKPPCSNVPKPVMTPTGDTVCSNARSMDCRKPGKRTGSLVMRSSLSSSKSVKTWSITMCGVIATCFLRAASSFWISRSR